MIALIASLFLSSVLVSSAQAETPVTPVINVTVVTTPVTDEASDATEIPTSQYGVSLVIASNCSVKVTAKNLSAVKAGKLVGEVEAAKSQCLTAKAERDEKARRDLASSARSGSENTLIAAGAEAIKNGHSVDYSSKANGDLHFVAGPAAEIGAAYQAYGQIRGVGGIVDSAGYLRTQARIGLAMPQTSLSPVAAPVTRPAASTDTDALGACRTSLKKKGELLEAKDKLLETCGS